MASSPSTTMRLELQVQGENDSTWGDKQKTNMEIIDAAFGRRYQVSLNGSDATLADANYTLDAAKYAVLLNTDADQDNRNIIIPNRQRIYTIQNASSYIIGVKTAAGSALPVPATSVTQVYCDGADALNFVTPLTNSATGAPNTASGAAASSVSVTPTGDLTSSNAQAALVELQGDIDAIEADLIANYQPKDQDLTDIANGARAKGAILAGTSTAWSVLGVGTNDYALIADSAQSAGVKWGILQLAGGGTGATTAAGARTNLGLVIGGSGAWWDKVGYVSAGGIMEIGKYIDFHESDAGVTDYDYRLVSTSGVLSGTGNFYITGTITASDNITAYSDVSLKENIVTIPNGLEMVKAMRGCAYTMKAGGKPGIGVIAQEIEQVLPEVVETNPGQGPNPGMKSVAYGNIVAVLIEAIKDMEKQVIDIATELNVCQQRLNALEGNGL